MVAVARTGMAPEDEVAPEGDLHAGRIDIASLTSPTEILAALRELDAEESLINSALDDILADTSTLETQLDRIYQLREVVDEVENEGEVMADVVGETAVIAERISGKVRMLDLEQSRVKESIDMVQAVQELKTAILSLHSSIERKEWETATRHMQRAMSIDPDVVNSKFAEAVVPTSELPSPPPQALRDFREQLLSTFLNEFQQAAAARDESNTSRFFKLFPIIGEEDRGLDAYAEFVCGVVGGRSRLGLKVQSPMYYASLITSLVEQIALIISQHQPVVERHYGPGKMLRVAERLMDEADRQGIAILSEWEEERRLAKKMSETRGYRFPHLASLSSSSTSSNAAAAASKRSFNPPFRQGTLAKEPSNVPTVEEEQIDVREIDSVLAEIAQISGRWELFRRFLYGRLKESSEEEASEEKTPRPNDAEEVNRTENPSGDGPSDAEKSTPLSTTKEADLAVAEKSAFKAALAEHMKAVYEPLEIWYLRNIIEKAHRIDEPDLTSSPYLSSALDDTFYILKKVLYRLASTSSITTLRSMSKEIRNVMERDFGEIMRRRMEGVYNGVNVNVIGGAGLGGSVGRAREEERERKEREARAQFMVYLNDLDMAAEYVVRLVDELMAGEALHQAFFIDIELEEARTAMKTVRSLEDKFRGVLKSGLDQLFNQLVRPRLRPLLTDCFKGVSYVLDEEAYNEAEYQDVLRKRFVKGWEGLVEGYRESFTTSNYHLFFSMTVNVLVRPWESIIKGMRFTELGAIRYDRDLRSIMTYLSSQAPFGVGVLRDGFARLQQIGTILNLDSADDADDFLSTANWKLTQAEIRTVLSLKAA